MKKIYKLSGMCVLLSGLMSCSTGSSNTGPDEHSHHHDESGEIELSERQMETVGIKLGQVMKKEIGSSLRANGVLAVNPQDIAEISPLLSGKITNISVTEGDHVNKNETVAQIENLDIVTYQQDYQNALEELKLSKIEFERQEKLAKEGAGIKRNLEQAQSSMKLVQSKVGALERQLIQAGINPEIAARGDVSGVASVKSPISGVVNKIYSTTGGFADISSPIMTVTDNNKIYAQLRIYEKDLDKVEKGQAVDITVINSGEILTGSVSDINKTIDEETRGINVKVRITDKDKKNLIPGMAITGFIRSGGIMSDVVPEDAVISLGGKNYIYMLEWIEDEDGTMMYHFEPVEVITGNREQKYVEITPIGELDGNAQIVISKAFYIASMAADHGEHNH